MKQQMFYFVIAMSFVVCSFSIQAMYRCEDKLFDENGQLILGYSLCNDVDQEGPQSIEEKFRQRRKRKLEKDTQTFEARMEVCSQLIKKRRELNVQAGRCKPVNLMKSFKNTIKINV